MNRKHKTNGRGDPLTETEIKQLSRMQPGHTMRLRGMLVRCHASSPCQSGANCVCCALHEISCQGVACMKGIHYTREEGIDLIRDTDVFYTIAI